MNFLSVMKKKNKQKNPETYTAVCGEIEIIWNLFFDT